MQITINIIITFELLDAQDGKMHQTSDKRKVNDLQTDKKGT